MKTKIKSDVLAKKVQMAAQAVSGKTNGVGTEILTCLKIDAKGTTVQITGMNSEISIVKMFEAEVIEEGSVAVPAKILADVVPFCKEEFTTLETVKGKLRVKSGPFKIELATMPVDNYPAMEQEELQKSVKMPAKNLRSMIAAVTPSAATDEGRPALAGVLLKTKVEENKGGQLILAAADGFRLAEAKWATSIPEGMEEIHVILPVKALEKLERILEGEDAVSIGLSGKEKIQFRHNGTTVTITPIDGKFPDYQAIIPTQAATLVSFGTSTLLEGLRSGRIIGLQGDFLIKPGANGKGDVTLDVESETGHVENKIEALMKGEPQDICVNLQYLREAIEGVEKLGYEGVYITTKGKFEAVLIMPPDEKDAGKPRAKFIVMPATGKKKPPEAEAAPAEKAEPVAVAA